MKFSNLIAAMIFCLPAFASAAWYTSTFTMKATHVDLVQLTKSPGFTISGKAVFEFLNGAARGGHLVLNGKAYNCRAFGFAVLVRDGEEQFYCNLTIPIAIGMIEENAEKLSSYPEAITTLKNAFKNSDYISIIVGFNTNAQDEKISDYKIERIDPATRTKKIDLTWHGSGVTEF